MKYILFSVLLLVACGSNEEEFSSIEGRWRIVQPQGVVSGSFEIRGGLVVSADFFVEGVRFIMTEPLYVEPYRILLDVEGPPRGTLAFEGYTPNSSFTRMEILGNTAVRRAHGGFEDFDDIYLTR